MVATLALFSPGRVAAQTLSAPYNFLWSANDSATNGDGINPSVLILSGDTLYGSAVSGGPNGSGTLFRVNTNGTGFTVLHYFAVAGSDTLGNITNSDGARPGGLMLSGGWLYGTSAAGGPPGKGTIFSLSTNGDNFTVLHTFSATNPDTRTNTDGAVPAGNLILLGGTLYGTATAGGYGASGTLFALNTNSLVFSNLYNFQGTDGAAPTLQVQSGDSFYATAGTGGQGSGLLFKINTNGSGWTLLHNFTATTSNTNADGAHPTALVLSGETLYGTTSRGGASSQGVLFALKTNDLGFTTLHHFSPVVLGGGSFTNGDGSGPNGVIMSGSYLYGSAGGGGLGRGTVFALNTNGTGFATLYKFAPTGLIVTNGFLASTNSGGGAPDSALIFSGRTLYGTASAGGAAGNGTIFALALPGVVPLNIQPADNNVILSWTNALFSLQTAPTLTDTFTNVPNATSPCTNAITGPPRFFRLIGP